MNFNLILTITTSLILTYFSIILITKLHNITKHFIDLRIKQHKQKNKNVKQLEKQTNYNNYEQRKMFQKKPKNYKKIFKEMPNYIMLLVITIHSNIHHWKLHYVIRYSRNDISENCIVWPYRFINIHHPTNHIQLGLNILYMACMYMVCYSPNNWLPTSHDNGIMF